MGCCISQTKEYCYSKRSINDEKHILKARDQEIEDQIKKDRQKMNREVKLLLLGAGESGKSTLLKQMIIIHDNGFSNDEKLAYREIVFSNTIESMKSIINAMQKFKIELSNPKEFQSFYDLINELPDQIECGYNFPNDISNAIQKLWNNETIKQVYERKSEYQLKDSAAYYFDNMERISDPEYIPNEQDILRSRVKTTGITETRFEIGQLIYRMVDVGGQRSERKKWIHCFEDVTAIIFMVAISEYDQALFEDETVNRMSESLMLFQSICDMDWFKNTSIILFMNKTDIFKNKIKSIPLQHYFPKYRGGDIYEQASQFLLKQFENLTIKNNSNRKVYTHFTCATDTNQIKFVMSVVNDIIIQTSLKDVGLL